MYRTAEFVSPSHPDKLCDIISDTLVDLYLQGDKNSRCAIETVGGHGKIFITGEVSSNTKVTETDIKNIVAKLTGIQDVTINLVAQSNEIANGVDIGGAGDQGIMIGYACRDNEELVPQEYYLARKLNKYIYEEYPFDGKTQVTIMDNNNLNIVCSFQHVSIKKLETKVTRFFNENYPKYKINSLYCNPAGVWNQGGFDSDAGLTGRKLVVDNYGPRIPIGGGAFSGKDASKVDRSAAYMARRIAVDYLKRFTAANEVQVQLSYAIGYTQPLQATAVIDNNSLLEIQITEYDLSPQGIIKFLDLTKPIYAKTAMWGHMGNGFNWK